MDLSLIINFILIFILLILTAFFVASEFAIVKVRKTRIEELAKNGHASAIRAEMIIKQLDTYLSVCQLGITITALALGWLGEPTFEHLLQPIFLMFNLSATMSATVSLIIAFSLMTFLHVVLGELVPKSMAIQRAESITLFVARPLYWFSLIMKPFVWLLNSSAMALAKIFGYKASNKGDAHSEDELRSILEESYEHGQINSSEYRYVDRIFEFDNRVAKEIMVPRTEMSVIDINDSLGVSLRTIRQEGYTRYPVVDGDKDAIIGILNIKRIFQKELETVEDLKKYITSVDKVFEHTPISQILMRMQKEREHLIILTDEYGGTSGIVTLEDIIEEIIGEVRDEFDDQEERAIKKLKNGHYLIEGRVAIQDINDYFDIDLPHEEVDTLSGWIYIQNYAVNEGDIYHFDNIAFRVVNIEEDRIVQIEAWLNTEENL